MSLHWFAWENRTSISMLLGTRTRCSTVHNTNFTTAIDGGHYVGSEGGSWFLSRAQNYNMMQI